MFFQKVDFKLQNYYLKIDVINIKVDKIYVFFHTNNAKTTDVIAAPIQKIEMVSKL